MQPLEWLVLLPPQKLFQTLSVTGRVPSETDWRVDGRAENRWNPSFAELYPGGYSRWSCQDKEMANSWTTKRYSVNR